MRVALFQMDISWEDKRANYAKVEDVVSKAAEKGADMLVLPEMFATGFTMNSSRMSEERAISQTLLFLSGLSKKHNLWMLGTMIEKTAKGARNGAFLFDRKGQLKGSYHKLHLFPLASEPSHYSAGEEVVSFDVEGTRCGIAICYDLRFPELFSSLCSQGAAVVFVPASWPKKRREHWLTLLRARAVDNQYYVAGVNRVGSGGGEEYCGDSAAFGPFGEQLALADDKEQLLLFDIDPARIAEVRKNYPFLESRRHDLF